MRQFNLADLCDEDRLLLYSASIAYPDDRFCELLDRSNSLDWDYIFDSSKRKSITSILYYKITQHNRQDSLPPHILDQLKKIFYFQMKRNLSFLDAFAKIADTFCKAGIAVIPLKGISLLLDTYPQEGLRPLTDIDVLVDFKQKIDADNILTSLGYDICAKNFFYYHDLYGLKKRHRGYEGILELHYELMPRLGRYIVNLSPVRILANSQIIDYHHRQYHKMNTEDEILYLATRFLTDIHNRPIRITDIDTILRVKEEKIKWDELVIKSRTYRMKAIIILCLKFLSRNMRSPIPKSVLDGFSMVNIPLMLEDVIEKRYFQNNRLIHRDRIKALFNRERRFFHRLFMNLLLADGTKEKILFMARMAIFKVGSRLPFLRGYIKNR